MPDDTINPLGGQRYALEGKVATMDTGRTVIERGVIYIHEGTITDVLPESAPPPVGFEAAPVVHTGGTIFPGLIELHNHLSYNILPLWNVPKQFNRRDQWRNHKEKQKLVTGPMKMLGSTPNYVEAIVRYVECKCLVSGVTTSQGLKLYGVGIDPYYKGIVRNVESPMIPGLPNALTRIADVEAKKLENFFDRLNSTDCLLLHLCEGLDDKTRQHFEALQFPDGSWAINDRLAGIHCAALTPEQFQIYGENGGAMVWSPLSNLLLYGDTARIQAAREAGVLIAIGSDWSPSGSKNLLGEMKVAHLVSEARGGVFTHEEIISMATINAARILKWDHLLGSIEAGKLADLLVVDNRQGDPYRRLINARETSVSLVVIDGVPRYGQVGLMSRFESGAALETLAVGSSSRALNLHEPEGDPLVAGLTLQAAGERLQDGLNRLHELAIDLEDPDNPIAWLADLGMTFDSPADAFAKLTEHALATGSDGLAGAGADDFSGRIAFLELDNEHLAGESIRPHLPHPLTGDATGFPFPGEQAVVYSEVLKGVQIDLDGLTIAGDETYFPRLAAQINLPEYIKQNLPGYYGLDPVLPESAEPFRRMSSTVRTQFATTMPLSDFMQTGGYLSRADRQRIVEQALVLIEQVYVHMPLKRAMHAVDPVQRLRLLQYHLEQQDETDMPPELEFHNELTRIFTSVRDLHTNYLLPSPYREKVAFLPFVIEKYYQRNELEQYEPRYLITKVVGTPPDESFKKGVEVLYWNGIPIDRAVQQNAERQAGGNPAARHARGLDAMTIRPLVRVLPPLEEWVTLQYRDENGLIHETVFNWLVFSPEPDPGGVDPDGGTILAAALGYDLQTDAIHQVRKVFFGPDAIQAQRDIFDGKIDTAAVRAEQDLPTSMPTVFRAHKVPTSTGSYDYVRIFTFQVQDGDEFVREFVRLIGMLEEQGPQQGLIIDVRGNGGGLIYAAERLLQVLTPLPVEPERVQFVNTPLTLAICQAHEPSEMWDDFTLQPWSGSIRQAVITGATYSRAVPITAPESIRAFSQVYYGPKVLITDALCYSATDMFAAGFKDHGIGLVIGTDRNTGAGGANVWTHGLLSLMLSEPEPPHNPLPGSPFKPLPSGTGMRVAVRRTLRAGRRSGTPLEDLGVEPDIDYWMTIDDLLQGNVNLIETAGDVLAGMPGYVLKVTTSIDQAELTVEFTTQNLERVDVFYNDRMLDSLNVVEDPQTNVFDLAEDHQPPFTGELRVEGYLGGKLVAVRRIEL